MDLKIAARIIAVLALGWSMIACVIPLRPDNANKTSGQTRRHPVAEPAHVSFDDAELLRYADIGMAALDDAGCRKAWAENRRHFLSTDRAASLMPETVVPSFAGEAPKP